MTGIIKNNISTIKVAGQECKIIEDCGSQYAVLTIIGGKETKLITNKHNIEVTEVEAVEVEAKNEMKIGTGLIRDMEIFKVEANKDIKRLGFDLKVEIEFIEEFKYGEQIRSKYANVILKGEEHQIKLFINKVA